MVEEIIAYSTIVVAAATLGSLGTYWYFFRKQNVISEKQIRYQSMLEIMKIFNEPQKAKERHVIYMANHDNALYKENGDIQEEYGAGILKNPLSMYVASTMGTFDLIGKLVKEEYVNKEEFLDMYVEPVIRMGKVFEKNIIFERNRRNSDHFMIYFDWIFNEARIYWDNNFSGQPEPEPF